jgi:hypothetical protein
MVAFTVVDLSRARLNLVFFSFLGWGETEPIWYVGH